MSDFHLSTLTFLLLTMLETDSIKLRALEPEDITLLYKWENDVEIWNISNTLMPFSKFVLKQYIESSINEDIFTSKQLRLIIELKYPKSKSIGTVDLFDIDFFNKRAGLGILIADKAYFKKGYASQSLDLIHDYCKTHLGLYQLYCNIDACNKNSITLFEKKNYLQTGTKKNWKKGLRGFTDVLFYQYTL